MDQNEKKEIKIGNLDVNERHVIGKSATQEPREYNFMIDKRMVNLIDTPGIGDVDGIDRDKKNFANILTFLSRYDKLHAVCILLKPNQYMCCRAKKIQWVTRPTHTRRSGWDDRVSTKRIFYKLWNAIASLKMVRFEKPRTSLKTSGFGGSTAHHNFAYACLLVWIEFLVLSFYSIVR